LIPLRDNIPTARFPLVTVLLIVANIIVFGWQLSFSNSKYSSAPAKSLHVTESDENTIEYGVIPYRLMHPGKDCVVGRVSGDAKVVCEGQPDARKVEASGQPVVDLDEPPWWTTLLSSMFMHGGLLHIGFNMLFLWIFGNNVEDSMGRLKFLAFYLLAGIAADYAQAGIDPSSTVPSIGASGAIAGVLGGYALLFPRARVLTLLIIIFFVTLVEIPALVMLGIWFALQFVPAIGQVANDVGDAGGVAYFAHLGGFIFGLAMIKLFARRRKPTLTGSAA
jgi:rhomboid family protein